MADVQLRTLRVQAELDASGYAAGAVQKEAADKRMSASGKEVAASVSQSDQKLSQSGDILARLSRQYVEGYASSQKFNQAISALTRGVELGRIEMTQAGAILDGIYKKYNMMANAAQIAEKGQIDLARAVQQANSRFQQQNTITAANTNAAANDAQYRRQNLGYQVMDIGQSLAMGMNPAMVAMQQLPQIAGIYAGNGGIKAALADVGVMAGAAVSSVGALPLALTAAGGAALLYFQSVSSNAKTADEVLKEHSANIKALGAAYGIAEQGARQFSVADQAVANAAAQGSMTTLMQEQLEAARALRLEFGSMQTRGKSGGMMFELFPDFQAFKPAFDQLDQGLRSGRVNGEKFVETINSIGQSSPKLKPLADQVLRATEEMFKLNTEAKKTEDLFARIQTMSLPNLDPLGAFDADRAQTDRANSIPSMIEQQRAQLEAIRLQAAAVSPEKKAAAARASAEAQWNSNESSTVRANRIELAEKQALIAAEEDLTRAQLERQRQSAASLAQAQFEASIAGKSIEAQNQLRAEYQATAAIKEAAARAGVDADEKEIALAKEKAAAVLQYQQQVAAGRMLQDQQNQLQTLQLEAQLIGASAEQRATLTAALQAEQQLRQQGISLISAEGQAYKANAVAIAQARLEVERQNAAFASLQQAGGSAIDSLTVGTGSLKDRLKSAADTMLQWIQQLTIANPLKNALFGSNLPTMADLFSGKPAVPGATTTGAMTVTAGTVMVNGGLTGGMFPSAPGGSTLSSVLGVPANQNVVNSVRPSLTSSGIINSPVAANQNSAIAGLMNSSSSGVLPTSVLGAGPGYTTFQMNDGSIIRRSGTFAWRNNNPGNIESGPFAASQPGYIPGGGRFAAFQTLDQGNAARAELMFNSPNYRNLTLSQAMYRYAPPSENNTESYINHLTANAGVDRNTVMSDFSAQQRQSILAAQMQVEGFRQGNTTVLKGADQASANLSKLSQTTAAASKDVGSLSDSALKAGTSLTDSLGKATAAVPQVPAVTPTATAPAGGNIFSSLFGGIFKLFGFADGTDNAPGGLAWVGERGRELVNLPRGSQVVPNHKLPYEGGQGMRGPSNVRHEYHISVSGNGDRELMERTRMVAEETVRSGIRAYDSQLPDRMEEVSRNPYDRAA